MGKKGAILEVSKQTYTKRGAGGLIFLEIKNFPK